MFVFLCLRELIHEVLMYYLISEQSSPPTMRTLIRSAERSKAALTPL